MGFRRINHLVDFVSFYAPTDDSGIRLGDSIGGICMSDDFLDTTQEVTIATGRDELLDQVRSTGKAILIVLVGGSAGERAVLGHEPFLIGRGSRCDLRINSDAVSREHAVIEKRGAVHCLVDKGSTNGSFVNYQRVSVRTLVDGDQIQIGGSMFKYLAGDNIETAYHEEFRRLARRDALTGALNRRSFDEEMQKVFESSKNHEGVSLILLDLDYFKQVNDSYGHTAGDLVLSCVGQGILAIVNAPHLFARVGGEEFAVVFRGKVEEALLFAEEIRQEIAGLKVEYEGQEIAVTASFGVAHEGSSPSELFEIADKLLYTAKLEGRNRVMN